MTTLLLPGLATVRANRGPYAAQLRKIEGQALAALGRPHRFDYSDVMQAGDTIERLAERLGESLLTRRRPVHLLGHSTGGSLALLLALNYPEQVSGLTLVSSGPRLSDLGRHVQTIAAAAIGHGEYRTGARALASPVTTNPLVRASLIALTASVPSLVLGTNPKLMRTLLRLEHTFDVTARLPQLQLPVRFITGELDSYYPPELVHMGARVLRQASVHVVPGRGHLSLYSPAVVKALRSHLTAA